MKLKTALDRLGIADNADVLSIGWDEAQLSRPAGMIPFLTHEYVRWACGVALLPEEMTKAVLSAARRVSADEALSALAWYCHHRLVRASIQRSEIRAWPTLTHALGDDAGMFYVLVLLSTTHQMQEVHRLRNIPPQIVADTVADLALNMRVTDYFKTFGVWGISPGILSWLTLHWRGQLYRLGRLQFVPGAFYGKLRAFRRRDTSEVVALSDEWVRYRADGQVDGTGGVFDADGGWTSRLAITGDEVVGSPIHPLGYAVRREAHLPLSEWKQVLCPGDPVLDVHIAAGSPMTHELCGDSIRQALEFFPRHFPDKPFVAFACSSWILDHQFERLLPESSNLVRFQKEMYLFPMLSENGPTLRAVFGGVPENMRDALRNTTMQRALARHIESGGHFQGGGCFLMVEDVKWGSQCYRRRCDAARRAGPDKPAE